VTLAAAAGLCALGVALEVAAFPPLGVWPLAFAMLAPLAAFADAAPPRAVFLFAWLGQWLAGVLVVHWLLQAFVGEYGVAPLPAVAFVVLVVGAYALLPALAAALFALLRERSADLARPLLFAALFVLAEWLRAEPLANPWVLAAQPLAVAPLFVQGADLGGAYLPGFCVAAAGAGLGIALRRRSAAPLAAPALLLAVASGYGAWRLAADWDAGATMRIGVVQAAVPQRERFQAGSAARNTRQHVELTRKLALREPLDLVVWSETSVDDDLDAHPELAELLRSTAAEVGAPIVTGAPRSAGGRLTNAVVLIDGAGMRGSYDKQVLVPFAEADPEWIGFLAPLLGPVTAGSPYLAGREARVFEALIPFSTPICFEITDPNLVRRFRDAGARLLVNLSNDAWFGATGYPELHRAHAVFRAIELRSWVARGTNTGISALIDPAGRRRAELGVGEVGSLSGRVGPAAPATFFARFGSGPFLALLALGAGVASWSGGRDAAQPAAGPSRRRRRPSRAAR